MTFFFLSRVTRKPIRSSRPSVKRLLRAIVASLVVVCPITATSSAFAVSADGELNLTLTEAVELALEHSRTLKIADARMGASAERVREARTAFLPKISGKGSYTRLDQTPYISGASFSSMFDPLHVPFEDLVSNGYLDPGALAGLEAGGPSRIYIGDKDNYALGVTVEQPIFTGFSIRNTYRIAKHALEAEKWNRQRDENEVRFAVAEAYVGLVRAKAFLEVAKESVHQLEAHIVDLESFLGEGMVIQNDLLRAEVELANAALLVNRAANTVDLATANLCHQLGVPLNTGITPTDPLKAEAETRTLSDCNELALRERPELRAMEHYLEIGQRTIALRRGQYLPSVFLIGNHEWKRPDREYEPEFYRSWNVTLALKANVFDWGAIHHQVAHAEMEQRQLEENAEILTDGILLQVKQSYLAWEEARRAVDLAGQAKAQAEENHRLALESFREGVATSTDLLDAEALLTRAKAGRVNAVAGLRLAKEKIDIATGWSSGASPTGSGR